MSLKKSNYFFILLFLLLAFSCTQYKEITKEDQIMVSGAWKKEKENNMPQLLLKLSNENDYPVQISFSVDYYLNGILEESNAIDDFCLKSGQTRKGKMNGIILSTENISAKQIESEAFDWKVNDMVVEKIEECP